MDFDSINSLTDEQISELYYERSEMTEQIADIDWVCLNGRQASVSGANVSRCSNIGDACYWVSDRRTVCSRYQEYGCVCRYVCTYCCNCTGIFVGKGRTYCYGCRYKCISYRTNTTYAQGTCSR